MKLSVRLPIPPSTNNLFINVKGKGRVMSSKYRDWKDVASKLVEAAWEAAGKPHFQQPMGVSLKVGMGYTGDIANREKASVDILGAVIEDHPDDRYIEQLGGQGDLL